MARIGSIYYEDEEEDKKQREKSYSGAVEKMGSVYYGDTQESFYANTLDRQERQQAQRTQNLIPETPVEEIKPKRDLFETISNIWDRVTNKQKKTENLPVGEKEIAVNKGKQLMNSITDGEVKNASILGYETQKKRISDDIGYYSSLLTKLQEVKQNRNQYKSHKLGDGTIVYYKEGRDGTEIPAPEIEEIRGMMTLGEGVANEDEIRRVPLDTVLKRVTETQIQENLQKLYIYERNIREITKQQEVETGVFTLLADQMRTGKWKPMIEDMKSATEANLYNSAKKKLEDGVDYNELTMNERMAYNEEISRGLEANIPRGDVTEAVGSLVPSARIMAERGIFNLVTQGGGKIPILGDLAQAVTVGAGRTLQDYTELANAKYDMYVTEEGIGFVRTGEPLPEGEAIARAVGGQTIQNYIEYQLGNTIKKQVGNIGVKILGSKPVTEAVVKLEANAFGRGIVTAMSVLKGNKVFQKIGEEIGWGGFIGEQTEEVLQDISDHVVKGTPLNILDPEWWKQSSIAVGIMSVLGLGARAGVNTVSVLDQRRTIDYINRNKEQAGLQDNQELTYDGKIIDTETDEVIRDFVAEQIQSKAEQEQVEQESPEDVEAPVEEIVQQTQTVEETGEEQRTKQETRPLQEIEEEIDSVYSIVQELSSAEAEYTYMIEDVDAERLYKKYIGGNVTDIDEKKDALAELTEKYRIQIRDLENERDEAEIKSPIPELDKEVLEGKTPQKQDMLKRASDVYRQTLEEKDLKENIDDTTWVLQRREEIENPERFREVDEVENEKGIRIGDRIRDTKEEEEGLVTSVRTDEGKTVVSYATSKHYGGWSYIENIEKLEDAKPPKTQKEQVKEVLKEGEAKSIKQIADETKILEPNIRRILGVGAKEGEFARVAEGVYVLKTAKGQVAYIETGNALESLPKLAKKGFKADMVFLDIPYDTPAVKGGNRGMKYNFITPDQFGDVLDSVNQILRSENSPVIYMFSQAKSGWAKMQKYNEMLDEKGLKVIAKGEWQKRFQNGEKVTNVRGEVAQPEGILLLSQSGKIYKDIVPIDLNFDFVRPKGYQSEKNADMIKEMIELTTNTGDVVLDPFAGSGVVPAEAIKAGRSAVAIEVDKKVVEETIVPRVQKASKEVKVEGLTGENQKRFIYNGYEFVTTEYTPRSTPSAVPVDTSKKVLNLYGQTEDGWTFVENKTGLEPFTNKQLDEFIGKYKDRLIKPNVQKVGDDKMVILESKAQAEYEKSWDKLTPQQQYKVLMGLMDGERYIKTIDQDTLVKLGKGVGVISYKDSGDKGEVLLFKGLEEKMYTDGMILITDTRVAVPLLKKFTEQYTKDYARKTGITLQEATKRIKESVESKSEFPSTKDLLDSSKANHKLEPVGFYTDGSIRQTGSIIFRAENGTLVRISGKYYSAIKSFYPSAEFYITDESNVKPISFVVGKTRKGIVMPMVLPTDATFTNLVGKKAVEESKRAMMDVAEREQQDRLLEKSKAFTREGMMDEMINSIAGYIEEDIPIEKMASIDGTIGYSGEGTWKYDNKTKVITVSMFDGRTVKIPMKEARDYVQAYLDKRNNTKTDDDDVAFYTTARRREQRRYDDITSMKDIDRNLDILRKDRLGTKKKEYYHSTSGVRLGSILDSKVLKSESRGKISFADNLDFSTEYGDVVFVTSQINPVKEKEGTSRYGTEYVQKGEISLSKIDRILLKVNEQEGLDTRIKLDLKMSKTAGEIAFDLREMGFEVRFVVNGKEVGESYFTTSDDQLMMGGSVINPQVSTFKDSVVQKTVAIKDEVAKIVSGFKSLKDFKKDFMVLYHGGQAKIIGEKLSTGGKVAGTITAETLGKGQDMGGIFFTPEKDFASIFTRWSEAGAGKVHNFLVETKNMFDIRNPEHYQMLKDFVGKKYKDIDGEELVFTEQLLNFMVNDGVMDWATFDIGVIQSLGFNGAVVTENSDYDGKSLMTYVLFDGGKDSRHWLLPDEIDSIEDLYKHKSILNRNGIVQPDPRELQREDTLLQEARKYGSAEEFVKAIDNQGNTKYWTPTVGLKTKTGEPVLLRAYHGTTKQFDNFIIPEGGVRYTGDGVYFFPAKTAAENYISGQKNGRVVESYLDLRNPYNLNLPHGNIDYQPSNIELEEIKSKKHDSIIVRTGVGTQDDIINEIVVFNTDSIMTKEQLIDIWNKAQSETLKAKEDESISTANLERYEQREITPVEELRIADEVRGLVRKYGEKIGEKYVPKGMLGAYFRKTKEVRVKGLTDLYVASHEIGHAIDAKYNITSRIKPRDEVDMALREAYINLYPNAKETHKIEIQKSEGFAMAVATFSERPNSFAVEYPTIVKELFLPSGKYFNSNLLEYLNDVSLIVSKYQSLNELDRVATRITKDMPIPEQTLFKSKTEATINMLQNDLNVFERWTKENGDSMTKADFTNLFRFRTQVKSIYESNISTNLGKAKKEGAEDRKFNNFLGGLYSYLKKSVPLDVYTAYNPETKNVRKVLDYNWGTLRRDIAQKGLDRQFNSLLVARRAFYDFEYVEKLEGEVQFFKQEEETLQDKLIEMYQKPEASRNKREEKELEAQIEGTKVIIAEIQANLDSAKSLVKEDGWDRNLVTNAYNNNKSLFEKELEMFDKLVEQDLILAKNVGIISNDKYHELKENKGYAPFKRIIYDEVLGEVDPMTITGNLKLSSQEVSSLKKRTGSTKEIIYPLQSAMRNHMEFLLKSVSQDAVNTFLSDKTLEFHSANIKKIEYSKGLESRNDVLIRMENGVRKAYAVDPMMKAVVTDYLTPRQVGLLEQVQQAYKQMFTMGTTGAYFQFVFTNLPRDAFNYITQTYQASSMKAVYNLFADTAKVILRKGDANSLELQYFQKYLALGGRDLSFAKYMEGDYDAFTKFLTHEETGLKKILAYAKKGLKTGLDILSLPSQVSEMWFRSVEFIEAKKSGDSDVVALEKARRVTTPFHHKGSFKYKTKEGSIKQAPSLPRYAPFQNAQLQAFSWVGGNFLKDSKRRSRTLFMIAFTTVLGVEELIRAWHNSDDDDKEQFLDLSAEDLSRFIHIPKKGGGISRVAVPEWAGGMAGFINMITMDFIVNATDYSLTDYATVVSAPIPDQFNLLVPVVQLLSKGSWDEFGKWLTSLVPALGNPIIAMMGYKTYPKFAPIESSWQKTKLPADRYNEGTSKLAKWAMSLELPFDKGRLGDNLNISPLQLDALLTQTFGRSIGLITGKKGAWDVFSSINREYYFEYGRRLESYWSIKEKNEQLYNSMTKGTREYGKEKELEVFRRKALSKDIDKALDVYKTAYDSKDLDRIAEARYKVIDLVNRFNDNPSSPEMEKYLANPNASTMEEAMTTRALREISMKDFRDYTKDELEQAKALGKEFRQEALLARSDYSYSELLFGIQKNEDKVVKIKEVIEGKSEAEIKKYLASLKYAGMMSNTVVEMLYKEGAINWNLGKFVYDLESNRNF